MKRGGGRRKNGNGRQAYRWHRWHRYAGLTSAAFVLVLALSGLLLNHTDLLRLGERQMESRLLVAWYGIEPPAPVSFRVGAQWLSHLGDRLYLGGRRIDTVARTPVGAVAAGRILVVAFTDELRLYTLPDAELVERVPPPVPLVRLGESAQGLVAGAAQAMYAIDEDVMRWDVIVGVTPTWSRPEAAPSDLRATLSADYGERGLSVERVLLDLHSGRFWGPWGPWVMDGAAVVFVFLAASGIYMWMKGRNR